MDKSSENREQRSGCDRRLMPRDDPGRRESDNAARQVLTEADEARLDLATASTKYILLLATVMCIGLTAVDSANTELAPLLNDQEKIVEVAEVLASGRSYLTYDLNIETRQLRAEQIWRLPRTPEVAVLGASHWQEGHASIAPGVDFYNAHVHRDYYEDILGVTETFVAAGKLPKKMIISIRDNQFLPTSMRTDFLWVPGLPYYRRMAERLGLPSHNAYAHGITPQVRQELSLPLLKGNVERYLAAPVPPQASELTRHPTLDTLLPDGSIVWSTIHQQSFTAERALRKALDFAAEKRDRPLAIDPLGVRSVDALLEFLVGRGVEVYLAHPPFNPVFWREIQGSRYFESVREVERITENFARKYDLKIIGSFDPNELGCTAEMYIDAEHSNPTCLSKVLDQFLQHDAAARAARAIGSDAS